MYVHTKIKSVTVEYDSHLHHSQHHHPHHHYHHHRRRHTVVVVILIVVMQGNGQESLIQGDSFGTRPKKMRISQRLFIRF